MTVKEIVQKKSGYTFDDLVCIMRILRGEGGCPWDREQTHESIRKNLIEETYEVVEAIDKADPTLMCEELGDLMLQVVFHAGISEEEGSFNIDDVCNGICEKLIVRHPHIFADTVADTSAEVLKNWDAIKQQTKNQKTESEKLNSIPPSLPALMRAAKASHKAAKAGLEHGTEAETVQTIMKQTERASLADTEGSFDVIGDLLFSVVELARKRGIDPEEALYKSTDRFVDRFTDTENTVLSQGKAMKDMSPDELAAIWDKIAR